jgi:hypothetical protein
VERFQVFIFIFAVVGHNCSDLEWDVSIKWLSSMGYMLFAVYLRCGVSTPLCPLQPVVGLPR